MVVLSVAQVVTSKTNFDKPLTHGIDPWMQAAKRAAAAAAPVLGSSAGPQPPEGSRKIYRLRRAPCAPGE